MKHLVSRPPMADMQIPADAFQMSMRTSLALNDVLTISRVVIRILACDAFATIENWRTQGEHVPALMDLRVQTPEYHIMATSAKQL